MGADNKKNIINIHKLEPGMILAEDLTDLKTGAVLIKQGAELNKKMIQSVYLFFPKEKYEVYAESVKEAEKEESPAGEKESPDADMPHYFEAGKKIDIESHLKPLPERISIEAQNIYKDSLHAIKGFYEKPEIVSREELYDAIVASGRITEEIIRDPQILLQISVLKAFDNYTFSHAVHVSIYASTLARFLNYSQDDIHKICLAALLHDIGKVDIPKEIINKPGALSPEEFEIMKEHVGHSYRRVSEFENIGDDILTAIYQHHERMDGEGYPEKISGDSIHKWARIIAIADVYDAVTTDRVYQGSLLPHVGAEIIMGSIGQLDYNYIQAFFRNMPIYPTGSKVRLNTGEVGVVSESQPGMHIRPTVQVLNEKDEVIKTIYLSKEFTTFIVEILHE